MDDACSSEAARSEATLPESDLLQFSGLQPEQIQAAVSKRILEYRFMIEDINDYIRQLKTFRNGAALLHFKLPPELLIHIFSFISPTRRADIRLTHVCRTWRDLIYQTPEFCVGMVAAIRSPSRATDCSMISAFLGHTASLPYTLQGLYRDHTGFLRTLQDNGQLSRLYELSITLPSNDPSFITEFAQLAMPGLQRLTCEANLVTSPRSNALEPRNHTPPPEANFPRLHKLILPDGLLLTPSLAFPSLKTIVHTKTAFNLDMLLMALQLCPQLEELVLNRWVYPTGTNVRFDALLSPCPLPCLRQCIIDEGIDDMDDPEPTYTLEFLTKIALPPTAHLEIRAKEFSLTSDVIPIAPRLSPAVFDTVDTLHFSLPSSDILYNQVQGSAGEVERINVILSREEDIDDSTIVYDATHVFTSAARITTLILECTRGNSVTLDGWLITLAALPFLTTIVMRARSCQQVLRALRRPQLHGGVLCPNLKRLSITCSNGGGVHELLVISMEWRASMRAPLNKLEYYNEGSLPLSTSRMNRLKAVVPEVLVLPGYPLC